MRRCPQCGNTYTAEEDKFCLKDGQPLVEIPPHDSRADTLLMKGAAKLPKVLEFPFQSESGIFTINATATATVLGVYLRPAPPSNQMKPFLCVREPEIPEPSERMRRFLLAGEGETVWGEYLTSFLSEHGYLLHVFEIGPEHNYEDRHDFQAREKDNKK
jgi:hypothetical protein